MSNIQIIKGDLLEAFDGKRVSVIAHCCNCFHKFGAGLALAIKNRYPRAHDADKMTKYADSYKMGQFSLSQQENGGFILNIYAQYGYGYKGQYVNYLAMTNGLENVKNWMNQMGLKTLGLPYKIGCGLAGGEWPVMLDLINYVFGDSEIQVTIFQFE